MCRRSRRSLMSSAGGRIPVKVGHNRRYEAHFDALTDRRRAEAPPHPCTLPSPAYGAQPLEWAEVGERPAVWAWISWRHRPAERLPAVAQGWNDRVVVVHFDGPTGTVSTVVWRNAVSRRES